MSLGLFMGGIMAGFVTVWLLFESIKRDPMEAEEPAMETNVQELQEFKVVYSMTAEEYNAGMDALMKIFQ